MKIAAFSDSHEKLHLVTPPQDFDILICAGDFTYYGEYYPVKSFLDRFKSIAGSKPAIIVPGNHELQLEYPITMSSNLMTVTCHEHKNLHYLIDNGININGINIWGSPYTPRFYDWAFNVDRDKIQKHWDKIPDNTDVLVLHGPPFSILDQTEQGTNVGCEALLNTIKTKLKNLKVCIFGHIHESFGHIKIDDVNYYNVSICNRNYSPINPVTIIEI